MDPLLTMYVVYLLVSVALTVWVASMPSKHGKAFLADVFNRDEHLVVAVNQLLVVGFYLVNIGFIALWLRTGRPVGNASQAVEALAMKVGTVALVLGGVHLVNVWVFNGLRRRPAGRAVPAGPHGAHDSGRAGAAVDMTAIP
jgi:hypothetical protein